MKDDPRDEGCLCQRCNRRYRVDVMLPDELWAGIHGAFNRLCGMCMTELIEVRGEFDYFELAQRT